jgi:hypothetical protein
MVLPVRWRVFSPLPLRKGRGLRAGVFELSFTSCLEKTLTLSLQGRGDPRIPIASTYCIIELTIAKSWSATVKDQFP